MLENGWEFADPSTECSGCIPDIVNNFKSIPELYLQSDPNYSGRFTVPILYDTKTKKIVNNESSEIIHIFNNVFNEFASNPNLDLYPVEMRPKIDEWNEIIYKGVNNGVYRAGFALSQETYEPNARMVYDTLILLENKLKTEGGPFVLGKIFTETDIRLFTSLIRYDPVYYGHFKCNLISIKELPNLFNWLKMIYEKDGIKDTVDMNHIKKHYYMSHKHINPTGVVPLYNGPIVDN